MSLSVESSFLGIALEDSSSDPVSCASSTPPTTVADAADCLSLHSDASKQDVINVADDAVFVTAEPMSPPTPPREESQEILAHEMKPELEPELPSLPPTPRPRPSRSAAANPVYNIAKLSGTDGHGKRRANGDIVAEPRRRRTVSGVAVTEPAKSFERPSRRASQPARTLKDVLSNQTSSAVLNSPRAGRQVRESTPPHRTSRRSAAAAASSSSSMLQTLGKRSRRAASNVPRELRRLQDTAEFAHRDEKPVLLTVWSNGKYVDPNAPVEPPKKKTKVEGAEEQEEGAGPAPSSKRRVKKWLDQGLYSGQDAPSDPTKFLSTAEKKKLASVPELQVPTKPNKTMPLPTYTGFRELLKGRDFKLPFHVCNPLPPGQPKPDEWRKMTRNRFIGDSKEYWRKMPNNFDDSSKCICSPEDGCGDDCQNRIMFYECDDTNCGIGAKECRNRAFADLTVRRAKGGKYRVGVEVVKTKDRGHGVRSNRCFEANQIIMEYAGEIITEEECDRRMNEEYKDNECYYLMSFDQNMIIDATTGSIARFVNHSCNPNCRMVKWVVAGQPRMALFAGDKPIMTGDELTYDYNFDPFSAKNVQKCLCGEPNCRGVLGPKKNEVKPPKTVIKNVVKATVKAGKRKLAELTGAKGASPAKKRKLLPAKGGKAATAVKAAKGAAAKVKHGVARVAGTRVAKPSPKAKANSAATMVKKVSTKRVTKTYSKKITKKRVSTKASTAVATNGKASPAKAKKTSTIGKSTIKKGGKPATTGAGKRAPVKKTPAIKVSMKSTATRALTNKPSVNAQPLPTSTTKPAIDQYDIAHIEVDSEITVATQS